MECVKWNSELILNTAEDAHLVLLKFFIKNEKKINKITQSPSKLLTTKKLK